MIEVIYKDEKQEAKGNEGIFDLPKNIRQIGSVDGEHRIYMEDYVYTFLGKITQNRKNDGETEGRAAVFTGEVKWHAGITYLFIKGALLIDSEEMTPEHIEFTDDIWQKVHEETEKYFPAQEIMGWFFAGKSLPMEVTEVFQRVHLKHFGGDKILMLMDLAEKEEAFFLYENSFMVRQSGYYIYYEKNPQMQNYMLEKLPDEYRSEHEEVHDDAVKAFRSIIRRKHKTEETVSEKTQDRNAPSEKVPVFSYAATACLVLAVMTVGVQFYRNYYPGQQERAAAETASTGTVSDKNVSVKNISDKSKSVANKVVSEVKEVTATPMVQVTPTSALHKDPTPIPTTEPSDREKEIYREESDERKAERRLQQEQQNQEEQSDRIQQENETQQNSQTPIPQENTGQQDAETSAQTGTQDSYVIRPGDTLYQISITKYGTMDKVAEICRMNGIEEDEIIYPGQIIVLP